MKLDRKFQNRVLNELADAYPRPAFPSFLNDTDDGVAAFNIQYLNEHGLIEGGVMHGLSEVMLSDMTITARGIDFLAEDGGLSAILGVVTVRLHADTIRDLLVAKVDAAPIAPDRKREIIDHLRNLPEVALAEAAKRLVGLGLESLPDAVQWLRTTCGI